MLEPTPTPVEYRWTLTAASRLVAYWSDAGYKSHDSPPADYDVFDFGLQASRWDFVYCLDGRARWEDHEDVHHWHNAAANGTLVYVANNKSFYTLVASGEQYAAHNMRAELLEALADKLSVASSAATITTQAFKTLREAHVKTFKASATLDLGRTLSRASALSLAHATRSKRARKMGKRASRSVRTQLSTNFNREYDRGEPNGTSSDEGERALGWGALTHASSRVATSLEQLRSEAQEARAEAVASRAALTVAESRIALLSARVEYLPAVFEQASSSTDAPGRLPARIRHLDGLRASDDLSLEPGPQGFSEVAFAPGDAIHPGQSAATSDAARLGAPLEDGSNAPARRHSAAGCPAPDRDVSSREDPQSWQVQGDSRDTRLRSGSPVPHTSVRGFPRPASKRAWSKAKQPTCKLALKGLGKATKRLGEVRIQRPKHSAQGELAKAQGDVRRLAAELKEVLGERASALTELSGAETYAAALAQECNSLTLSGADLQEVEQAEQAALQLTLSRVGSALEALTYSRADLEGEVLDRAIVTEALITTLQQEESRAGALQLRESQLECDAIATRGRAEQRDAALCTELEQACELMRAEQAAAVQTAAILRADACSAHSDASAERDRWEYYREARDASSKACSLSDEECQLWATKFAEVSCLAQERAIELDVAEHAEQACHSICQLEVEELSRVTEAHQLLSAELNTEAHTTRSLALENVSVLEAERALRERLARSEGEATVLLQQVDRLSSRADTSQSQRSGRSSSSSGQAPMPHENVQQLIKAGLQLMQSVAPLRNTLGMLQPLNQIRGLSPEGLVWYTLSAVNVVDVAEVRLTDLEDLASRLARENGVLSSDAAWHREHARQESLACDAARDFRDEVRVELLAMQNQPEVDLMLSSEAALARSNWHGLGSVYDHRRDDPQHTLKAGWTAPIGMFYVQEDSYVSLVGCCARASHRKVISTDEVDVYAFQVVLPLENALNLYYLTPSDGGLYVSRGFYTFRLIHGSLRAENVTSRSNTHRRFLSADLTPRSETSSDGIHVGFVHCQSDLHDMYCRIGFVYDGTTLLKMALHPLNGVAPEGESASRDAFVESMRQIATDHVSLDLVATMQREDSQRPASSMA
jgi:hypothetical protein